MWNFRFEEYLLRLVHDIGWRHLRHDYTIDTRNMMKACDACAGMGQDSYFFTFAVYRFCSLSAFKTCNICARTFVVFDYIVCASSSVALVLSCKCLAFSMFNFSKFTLFWFDFRYDLKGSC